MSRRNPGTLTYVLESTYRRKVVSWDKAIIRLEDKISRLNGKLEEIQQQIIDLHFTPGKEKDSTEKLPILGDI